MSQTRVQHSKVGQQIFIILSGFVLVMFIVGFASKIGIDSINENKQRLEEIVNTNNLKFKLLTIMSDAIRDRMLVVYDMTNTEDPFDLDELNTLSNQKVRDFIIAREELQQLGLTTIQLQQLDEQRAKLSQAQTILNAIIEQALNGVEITNIDKITEARAANNLVLQSLLDMQNSQNGYAKEQLQLAEELAQKTQQQILWLALAAFIASAVVVGVIIRHMVSQGLALNRALHELHESNSLLEQRVEQRTAELMTTKAQNMRMTAELDAGRKLQQIILPTATELQQITTLDIAAYMQPAEEVGGDYYDLLTYEDGVHIAIGDVTGHGLESGIIMLMTQAAMRSQLQQQRDVAQVLQQVNRTLYDNVQRMGSDKHLTLALCNYRYQQGIGRVQLCGQHETVIVVRNSGVIEEFETDSLGFPVGLIDSIAEYINIAEIALHPGDLMVLYTDGVSEAANEQHQLFGVDALKGVLQRNYQQSAEVIKQAIINAIQQHSGAQPLYDDITLLILKQLPTITE